jgi:hypothetical protein
MNAMHTKLTQDMNSIKMNPKTIAVLNTRVSERLKYPYASSHNSDTALYTTKVKEKKVAPLHAMGALWVRGGIAPTLS